MWPILPTWPILPYLTYLETERRQYEGHNTPLGYHTDQGSLGSSQYDWQGEYCGLNMDSEVFLNVTTQLFSCLSSILSSPHFRWVVNH